MHTFTIVAIAVIFCHLLTGVFSNSDDGNPAGDTPAEPTDFLNETKQFIMHAAEKAKAVLNNHIEKLKGVSAEQLNLANTKVKTFLDNLRAKLLNVLGKTN